MNAPADWTATAEHGERLSTIHIRDLFASDPDRFERLSCRAGPILADFSKEKIDADALAALHQLARDRDVFAQRDAMMGGDAVNRTENQPALHMALRAGPDQVLMRNGRDIIPELYADRDRMLAFAESVRSSSETAADGGALTDIVAIGIGGSELGTTLALQALSPWVNGPRVHSVSNIDGTHLADTVRMLDPARTLVIVVSKSFTTPETATNARSARDWLGAHGANMAAVTARPEFAQLEGFPKDRIFAFPRWVGGRFSIWSSVALPLAIACGSGPVLDMHAGAARIDQHFHAAPANENLPLLLGLIAVWRRNALGCSATAMVPYNQRLARLPAYLQQLEMESNGKTAGAKTATAPVLFGEPGASAQHSFFQLLHQGTDIVPVDFLVAREHIGGLDGHQPLLAASAFAQAAALAFGEPADPEDPFHEHRNFPGDRPSTTLLFDRLDPETLGALIALFEHRTFVQAVLWGINPFDQFGVELGKRLTNRLTPLLEGGDLADLDSSTAGLIRAYRNQSGSG